MEYYYRNATLLHICIILPVSCGRPITPDNGSIEAHQNTTEGAGILFRCDPGFVPAGRMRAVCGADGRWKTGPQNIPHGEHSGF